MVYLVFNTLFNLVDAGRQADCFRNVARVLAPDGAFIVETFVRQTVLLTEQGVRLKPFAMRYAWPAQIDELAQAAGLHLAERYADWLRAPFTADSRAHISGTGKVDGHRKV